LRQASGGGSGFAVPLTPGLRITQNIPLPGGGTKKILVASIPRRSSSGASGLTGAGGAAGGTTGAGSAQAFLDNLRADIDAANKATEADRNRLLEAIAEFNAQGAGFNQADMDRLSSDTRQREEAKNREILRRMTEQMASSGRVASPTMLGQVAKRLAVQSEDVIQNQRASLEIESAGLKQRHREFGLSMLSDTLAGTRRETIDPNTALNILNIIGRGSSQVAPFSV
jgi:hypothetical protein